MNAPNHSLADELNAALAWWQMAGVTYDYAADATDWLGEEAAPGAPMEDGSGASERQTPPVTARTAPEDPPKNIAERADLLGESPPATLDAFAQFWLEAPGLDAIGPRGRVAPRGPANPDLMVLVTDPEATDGDRLLSGHQGRLLSNMLGAMGLSEEKVYFASALPRHTPMADTAFLAASGMDAVTLHHVGLVSPQKLLVLGRGILPLLGQNVSQPYTSLREINQNSRSTPLMVSEGLESLMASPVLKAKFWRRWIEWAAEMR